MSIVLEHIKTELAKKNVVVLDVYPDQDRIMQFVEVSVGWHRTQEELVTDEELTHIVQPPDTTRYGFPVNFAFVDLHYRRVDYQVLNITLFNLTM